MIELSKRIRLASLIALLIPVRLFAQGPFGPTVLFLPSGPRTLAMGNVGIVGRDDDVLFFNPAQLVIARGMSASAERYSATAGGGALSTVTRLASGGIAIGMRMANYETLLGNLPGSRAGMLDPGEGGTTLEASIGFGQVVKGTRFGAAVKYAEDDIARVPLNRIDRVTADVGLSRDFMRFYTVGLAVQNIGQDRTGACSAIAGCSPFAQGENNTVFLPIRTTLGAGTSRPLGVFDVSATAALTLRRAETLFPAGGVEVGYSWLDGYSIALRAGARRPEAGERVPTAGAGFTMDRLSIDYAIEALSGSHFGQRIGLRLR
jgi:hypothetical protein